MSGDRGRGRSWGAWLALAVIAALLAAACDDAASEPTPDAPAGVIASPLAASPTVNPVAPLPEGHEIREPGLGSAGVSNPTLAGLAAEGQPDEDLPTVTPRPTQPTLPLIISGADGLVLQATLYGAPVRPAPGVLLLHMAGGARGDWDPLPEQLQAAGYAVLAVDLRGHGLTGGAVDWARAVEDAGAALRQLAELPGVQPDRVIVIGAGMSANLGLRACVDEPACAGIALLSPGLDYRGITTGDAMARVGFRPVLIVAGENDDNNPTDSVSLDGLATGPNQLVIYPAGHGTDLLVTQPDLPDLLAGWLAERFPPPG